MESRYPEIIGLLMRYPLTAEQIFVASRAFARPFSSPTRVREAVRHLHSQGFLGREAIPGTGPGQKRHLYFLRPKAKLLLPDVADCAPSVFRGFSESIPHNLALFEALAHIERAMGELGEHRIRLLAAIRPRHFTFDGASLFPGDSRKTKLIPDYTLLLNIKERAVWKPSLLFIELQRQTAIINPTAPATLARSFTGKLLKYKALARPDALDAHPIIRQFRSTFDCPLRGFRVLTIVARHHGAEAHERSLRDAAASLNIRELVWFTTLNKVVDANAMTQRIWTLATGTQRSLVDGIG